MVAAGVPAIARRAAVPPTAAATVVAAAVEERNSRPTQATVPVMVAPMPAMVAVPPVNVPVPVPAMGMTMPTSVTKVPIAAAAAEVSSAAAAPAHLLNETVGGSSCRGGRGQRGCRYRRHQGSRQQGRCTQCEFPHHRFIASFPVAASNLPRTFVECSCPSHLQARVVEGMRRSFRYPATAAAPFGSPARGNPLWPALTCPTNRSIRTNHDRRDPPPHRRSARCG